MNEEERTIRPGPASANREAAGLQDRLYQDLARLVPGPGVRGAFSKKPRRQSAFSGSGKTSWRSRPKPPDPPRAVASFGATRLGFVRRHAFGGCAMHAVFGTHRERAACMA